MPVRRAPAQGACDPGAFPGVVSLDGSPPAPGPHASSGWADEAGPVRTCHLVVVPGARLPSIDGIFHVRLLLPLCGWAVRLGLEFSDLTVHHACRSEGVLAPYLVPSAFPVWQTANLTAGRSKGNLLSRGSQEPYGILSQCAGQGTLPAKAFAIVSAPQNPLIRPQQQAACCTLCDPGDFGYGAKGSSIP